MHKDTQTEYRCLGLLLCSSSLILCPWVRMLSECNAPGQGFREGEPPLHEEGQKICTAPLICLPASCLLSVPYSFFSFCEYHVLSTLLGMGNRQTWLLPSWLLWWGQKKNFIIIHHPCMPWGYHTGNLLSTLFNLHISQTHFYTDACRRSFSITSVQS